MQQRRVRLGDILDDYCPRERRVTNHAVVAMIDDTVKQTRCTTCDAEHEYKEARIPAPRRRKTGALGAGDAHVRPRPVAHAPTAPAEEPFPGDEVSEGVVAESALDEVERAQPEPIEASQAPIETEPESGGEAEQDEWPVHRPLIRATLPRPEGQTPERKLPDFTFRPGGGRVERNGQRHRHRPTRHAHGSPSGQNRFGGKPPGSGQGQRHGAGQGQQQRHGNRQGPGGGGRPGQGRGSRPGGSGRKRGR